MIPWNRSSGRSIGQAEAADCSGKAGMVAIGVSGWGRVWVWIGSGSGRAGRSGSVRKRVMSVIMGCDIALIMKEKD